MIRRTKSFSSYGTVLTKRMSHQPASGQTLQKILYNKGVQIKLDGSLRTSMKPAKIIEGFDKITSRQTLSSFQTFNTKDFLKDANYQNKQDKLMAKYPNYSVRKQSDIRLSKLIPKVTKEQEYTDKNKQACKKCAHHQKELNEKYLRQQQKQKQKQKQKIKKNQSKLTKRSSSHHQNRRSEQFAEQQQNSQKNEIRLKINTIRKTDQKRELLTTRDLQNQRKSYHNLDFSKQINRPPVQKDVNHYNNDFAFTQENFYQNQPTFYEDIKEPEVRRAQSQENGVKLSKQNFFNRASAIFKPKQDQFRSTVHSFNSYTKRKYLSQQKLRAAPPTSGIDYYKIPLQKYRGGWKQISPPKFDTVANKFLNRYDRDTPFWYTKLQYEAGKFSGIDKQKEKSNKNIIRFDQQTDRQKNQVQSKYPIRIAI